MILVTGATGTIGTEVLTQLVAAGADARVLVRRPGTAAPKAGGAQRPCEKLAREWALGSSSS